MTEMRDVVLVTVDSLRADHCGFMGYDEAVTPTLDALAEDGLVFENAIAPAPETNSSVATFMTGFYSNPNLESDLSRYTERTREHMRTRRTLPQRFAELGYETAGFTANPWTSRYFNFDRDFDHFEDTMDENLASGLNERGSTRGVGRDLAANLLNWIQGQDMFMDWESLYDEIEHWLADVDSPYFCWIFLVDVHMPYLPPASYRSRSRLLNYPANLSLFLGAQDLPLQGLFHDVLVDSYDDAIRYTDTFVDQLLEDLEPADGGEAPIVAFTSDHGEGFGEHGLYGHGPNLSEEALHVPLLIANGPSGRVTDPVSLMELPELLPALASGQPIDDVGETTVWSRNYDPAILVRGRRWRYEWRPDRETVAVRDDGEWEERSLPELESIGRDLVELHVEHERERGRIHDAADAVAGGESVAI